MQAFFEISRWQALDISSSTGSCLKNLELVTIPLSPILLHTFNIPNTTQNFAYLQKNVIPTKLHSATSSFMKPQLLVHFNFLKVLKFWLYTHFLLFQNKLETVLHIKLKIYNLITVCTPIVYIFLFQLMAGKWIGAARWRSSLTDTAKTINTF